MPTLPRRTLLIATITLSLSWIYQGLVPKILFPYTGEMEMLMGLGLFPGVETFILTFIGTAEVLFGVGIFFVRTKLMHVLNIVGLLFLAGGALISKPSVYTYPFSPFALSLSMMALSVVCIINLEQPSGGSKQ